LASINHKEVYAALAGVVSRRKLHRALTAYTNDPVYREQLKPGTARIDLSGEPAGVVTPEQVPPPPKPKPTPSGEPAGRQRYGALREVLGY
jgi:ProQ/FINO family